MKSTENKWRIESMRGTHWNEEFWSFYHPRRHQVQYIVIGEVEWRLWSWELISCYLAFKSVIFMTRSLRHHYGGEKGWITRQSSSSWLYAFTTAVSSAWDIFITTHFSVKFLCLFQVPTQISNTLWVIASESCKINSSKLSDIIAFYSHLDCI